MNIAISGESGFVGKHLSAFLMQFGHQILPLGRDLFKDNRDKELIQILSKSDIVINLAGAPINKRWTKTYKEELFNSRILVTRRIVNAIKASSHRPHLMISTSAVGYYPSQGCYDEYDQTKATGFLAELCRQWEHEASQCPSDVRVAITRFGVVLSPDGGALQPMLFPVKLKVSTVIAPGNQPFPWISMTDLCHAMFFIIQTPTLYGAINFVVPEIVTQKTFSEVVGQHFHTWISIPVPSFIFRIIYGEAASVLTTGQQVIPLKLLGAGYTFIHPTIEDFWKDQPTK